MVSALTKVTSRRGQCKPPTCRLFFQKAASAIVWLGNAGPKLTSLLHIAAIHEKNKERTSGSIGARQVRRRGSRSRYRTSPWGVANSVLSTLVPKNLGSTGDLSRSTVTLPIWWPVLRLAVALRQTTISSRSLWGNFRIRCEPTLSYSTDYTRSNENFSPALTISKGTRSAKTSQWFYYANNTKKIASL